jgi:hypothetical protein
VAVLFFKYLLSTTSDAIINPICFLLYVMLGYSFSVLTGAVGWYVQNATRVRIVDTEMVIWYYNVRVSYFIVINKEIMCF